MSKTLEMIREMYEHKTAMCDKLTALNKKQDDILHVIEYGKADSNTLEELEALRIERRAVKNELKPFYKDFKNLDKLSDYINIMRNYD